jgi:hypothetical protein
MTDSKRFTIDIQTRFYLYLGVGLYLKRRLQCISNKAQLDDGDASMRSAMAV